MLLFLLSGLAGFLHYDGLGGTRFLAGGAPVTGLGVDQGRDIFGIEFETLVGAFVDTDAATGTFLGVDYWPFQTFTSAYPGSKSGVSSVIT